MSSRSRRLLLLPLVPLLILGCGDDDPAAPGGSSAPDFSGSWSVTLTVTSKVLCDREVGDFIDLDFVILQEGNQRTLQFDSGKEIDLTLSGSSITGSFQEDGSTFALDMRLEGGELGGIWTETRTIPAPCTQIWSVAGTRTNAAPAPGFAGDWDLTLQVTDNPCDREEEGLMQTLCRRIRIDRSTVIIEDPEGNIRGIGDGATARLLQREEGGELMIDLSLTGDALFGTVVSTDFDSGCQTTFSVNGTRRTSPCPPPGNFAGPWDIRVTVTQSECFDEPVGQMMFLCGEVTVDGTSISFDDGSADGPMEGDIDGNRAELRRSTQIGELTVEFELDGDSVSGTAMMVYTGGECAGITVQYAISGDRRSEPCGSGGDGDFDGFWDVTGSNFQTDCKGVTYSDECVEWQQSGSSVFWVEEGSTGTVDGDVATFFFQETFGTVTITGQTVVQLTGPDSFSGSTVITFADEKNPSADCSASVDIDGTRVTACPPQVSSGSRGLIRWRDSRR